MGGSHNNHLLSQTAGFARSLLALSSGQEYSGNLALRGFSSVPGTQSRMLTSFFLGGVGTLVPTKNLLTYVSIRLKG